MNRDISDITINTAASLRDSGSSKILRSDSLTSVKASRNTKYKVKGSGGCSRWRAAVRRDSSLKSIMGRRQNSRDFRSTQSISSSIGRGLDALRLANYRNEKFDAKNAAIGDSSDPHICIKSVELQEALHRDIDSQSVGGNSDDSKRQDRWSSETSGKNAICKPRRRGSDDNLS